MLVRSGVGEKLVRSGVGEKLVRSVIHALFLAKRNIYYCLNNI